MVKYETNRALPTAECWTTYEKRVLDEAVIELAFWFKERFSGMSLKWFYFYKSLKGRSTNNGLQVV